MCSLLPAACARRHACGAELAGIGLPRGNLDPAQGVEREPKLDRLHGPIDHDGRCDGLDAGSSNGIDGLDQGGAGGEDVVDDHDPLVGGDRPAAAQRATATSHGFRERRAHRATELACGLEGEEHPTGRRSDHQGGGVWSQRLCEAAAQLHPGARVLQDQELLEVAAGVAARLQEEVAVQQGAGIGEERLDGSVAEVAIGHS